MTNNSYNLTDIKNISKILLHTHLEGSISEEVINKLIEKNDFRFNFPISSKKISQMCLLGGWNTFFKIILNLGALIQSIEDIEYILFNYASKLKENCIIYAEIHFTPWLHCKKGLKLDDISKIFAKVITKIQKDFDIKVKIIFDLIRDQDEDASSIVDWLINLPKEYFAGMGISGSPTSKPIELYKNLCEKVKKNGYGLVVHAGVISDNQN